uniref:Uncharacterized protein n=1 Tax=Glossina brevipalpis TaxID=37001 RepID=A0A1A9WKQ2_9MUSC
LVVITDEEAKFEEEKDHPLFRFDQNRSNVQNPQNTEVESESQQLQGMPNTRMYKKKNYSKKWVIIECSPNNVANDESEATKLLKPAKYIMTVKSKTKNRHSQGTLPDYTISRNLHLESGINLTSSDLFKGKGLLKYCRMSWFLIETDEGLCLGANKEPNGKRFFVIIHSMELIDDESENMYVDRKVRFMWKQEIVEGKIRFASDERDYVNHELKILQQDEAQDDAVVQSNKPKSFIVQYRRGTDALIYRILSEKENGEDMSKNVVLEDYMPNVAKILYMNESQELLLQELNLLKKKCFEMNFRNTKSSNMLASDWLLIQYSSGPFNLTYKIINYSETVWQNENKFPDVIAYIKANDLTFQGIIVNRSQDYDELKKMLQVIQKIGLEVAFPLESFRHLAEGNCTREEENKTDRINKCAYVLDPESEQIFDLCEGQDLKATKSLIDLSRLSGGSDRLSGRDTIYDLKGEVRGNQGKKKEEGKEERAKSVPPSSPQVSPQDTRELANEVKGNRRRYTDTTSLVRSSVERKEPKEKILQVIDYTIDKDFVEIPKSREPDHQPEILNLDRKDCGIMPVVSRDKCARIDKLEEQVSMLRQELSRVKEEFVPMKDLLRFNSISERLRELNSLLSDLKHNCNRARYSDYPDDEDALEKHIKTVNLEEIPPMEITSAAPLSSAQREEPAKEKNPPSLPSPLPTPPPPLAHLEEEEDCDFTDVPLAIPRSENFKIVNDYRVDPEVRRQRLDKRDQARAEVRCQKHKQQQFPENAQPIGTPEKEEAKSKCLRFEWDNSPIPPLVKENQSQKNATPLNTSTPYVPESVLLKRTSEAQTDRRKWGPTHKKKTKCSQLDSKRTSEFEHLNNRCTNELNQIEKGHSGEDDREFTAEVETDQGKWDPTRKKKTTCSHVDARRATEFDNELISVARASRVANGSRMQNGNAANDLEMCDNMNLPLLTSNLNESIYGVLGNVQPSKIALTILLQVDNLYHINVSVMRTGQSLGCLYATEECIIEANQRHVFEEFLTFFVVDSMNTMEQKNKILSHSFDYIKN